MEQLGMWKKRGKRVCLCVCACMCVMRMPLRVRASGVHVCVHVCGVHMLACVRADVHHRPRRDQQPPGQRQHRLPAAHLPILHPGLGAAVRRLQWAGEVGAAPVGEVGLERLGCSTGADCTRRASHLCARAACSVRWAWLASRPWSPRASLFWCGTHPRAHVPATFGKWCRLCSALVLCVCVARKDTKREGVCVVAAPGCVLLHFQRLDSHICS